MVRRTDTRQRMLETAAELFHTQGYHATGLNQLVAAGGAPKGSLYFHFPGGKEQLAAEALRLSGGTFREMITRVVETAPDAATAVCAVIDGLIEVQLASGFQRGCPLATVAMDASSEPVREACADGYASWLEGLSQYFVSQRFSAEKADELATIVLASVEGGLLLARTRHDVAPLRAVREHLRATIERELP
ncbi:TetR/AcrR family transcriptional regulator [Amycolatopsis sp. cg5]|uniref:TetR/AcrR family transcriptional regulator n=1 Tax=Amycolatopsis sp. cg5 TaxID=3238802 RepID=UPI003526BA60